MKTHVQLTGERDIPLLLFLWKWKVLTTAAIARRFYPHSRLSTAYRRLWCLERAGFIQINADSGLQIFVWTLTKKGFAVIQDTLPQLKEEGYLSEHINHDFLVTAAHLGDWLCGAPNGVDFFTEQQLRRYHRDLYPSWVSKKELHRPDGYWRLKSGDVSKTFALEVELSQKAPSLYRDPSIFYSHFANVHRVLWIVSSTSIAKTVIRAMGFADSPNTSFHNFVRLHEFQKTGWRAPIFLGNEHGRTISSFLNIGPTNAPHTSVGFLLLDGRKSYQRSKVCANPTAA
ncbi:MAG: hypothetical protein ABL958_11590 [Bdellovibrionia bacterium]